MAQTDTETLDTLPIRAINFGDPNKTVQHDKMVSLVEKMPALNKELPGKVGQEKTVTHRQIGGQDTAEMEALG